MIPEHTGPGEIPHDLEALAGICVVTDHIPEAMELGAPVLARIGKHGLQRLQIGMDVT
jgi:hypothetical protein